MLFQQLLLASTASATCLHGLSKFKRAEGEGETVEVGKFGYTGLIGPINWASLAVENEACKNGTNQSPINIDESVTAATEKPTLDIPEQAVEFENLGTTIEVVVNGTTSFAGTDFRLRQFHIHTPSEHRLSEEFFPLEVHMVHEGVTDANNIAVIALMFQMSTEASAPILSGLQPHLEAIATPGTKTAIEDGLDFSSVIEHVQNTELLQYTGSLTTPPCSEGVTFLITKEPLPIDVTAFNDIKKVVKFNSRFTQNALGQENFLGVGTKAGTTDAVMPESLPGDEAAEEAPAEQAPAANGTAVAAAAVTPGQTITVTEIQGEATQVVGVVVEKKH